MSQARDYLGRGYQQAEEMVAENPLASVLIAFGIGLGLGVMVSSAFAGSERRFMELSTSEKAQRVGRRVFDTLSQVVPESVSSRLHS